MSASNDLLNCSLNFGTSSGNDVINFRNIDPSRALYVVPFSTLLFHIEATSFSGI